MELVPDDAEIDFRKRPTRHLGYQLRLAFIYDRAHSSAPNHSAGCHLYVERILDKYRRAQRWERILRPVEDDKCGGNEPGAA